MPSRKHALAAQHLHEAGRNERNIRGLDQISASCDDAGRNYGTSSLRRHHSLHTAQQHLTSYIKRDMLLLLSGSKDVEAHWRRAMTRSCTIINQFTLNTSWMPWRTKKKIRVADRIKNHGSLVQKCFCSTGMKEFSRKYFLVFDVEAFKEWQDPI